MPEQITWQSLKNLLDNTLPYCAREVERVRDEFGSDSEFAAVLAERLAHLKWLVPFVERMQDCAPVQSLQPMLSLQTIRLIDETSEFAWVRALAEEDLELSRVTYLAPLHYDVNVVVRGNTAAITAAVELLVREKREQRNT